MHCCLIGVGDTLTDALVTTAKYRKYGDSQRNALKLVAVTFTKDQFKHNENTWQTLLWYELKVSISTSLQTAESSKTAKYRRHPLIWHVWDFSGVELKIIGLYLA